MRWNYTIVLNIMFLPLSAALAWRFLHAGGPKMLRMMSAAPEDEAAHVHAGHRHHHR